MAAIELRNVVKTFGPITAVDGLDLEVPAGICLGLLGPNGAGKSTTMRLLTGQAIANAGRLRAPGYDLPGESKPPRAGRRGPRGSAPPAEGSAARREWACSPRPHPQRPYARDDHTPPGHARL